MRGRNVVGAFRSSVPVLTSTGCFLSQRASLCPIGRSPSHFMRGTLCFTQLFNPALKGGAIYLNADPWSIKVSDGAEAPLRACLTKRRTEYRSLPPTHLIPLHLYTPRPTSSSYFPYLLITLIPLSPLSPYLSTTQFSNTNISICVLRKQSSASRGVLTMGSFSLKEVFKRMGTPVRSRNLLMRAW